MYLKGAYGFLLALSRRLVSKSLKTFDQVAAYAQDNILWREGRKKPFCVASMVINTSDIFFISWVCLNVVLLDCFFLVLFSQRDLVLFMCYIQTW